MHKRWYFDNKYVRQFLDSCARQSSLKAFFTRETLGAKGLIGLSNLKYKDKIIKFPNSCYFQYINFLPFTTNHISVHLCIFTNTHITTCLSLSHSFTFIFLPANHIKHTQPSILQNSHRNTWTNKTNNERNIAHHIKFFSLRSAQDHAGLTVFQFYILFCAPISY